MLQIADTKPNRMKRIASVLDRVTKQGVPLYIMGINEYADRLLSGLKQLKIHPSGIIDDYSAQESYNGFPVEKTSTIPPESVIISCVIEGRLVAAIDRLHESGQRDVLTYFDLHLINPDFIPPAKFCEDNMCDIKDNWDKYNSLYNRLEDETSRDTLSRLLDFRYNYNIESMRTFSLRLEEQYFDLFPMSDIHVFVDCGSFNGLTTRKFAELNPDYEKVHVFEPSPSNFNLASKALETLDRIALYPFATYKEQGNISFDSSQGSASGISESGDVNVRAVKIDDLVSKADYIKLDVEGAEYDSLVGARLLIESSKPKLAVCVYHNQSDFWRIPEYLLRIHPDYKVYLRHYSQGLFETVMYFI